MVARAPTPGADGSARELAALRAGVRALRIMVGVVFAATVFDNIHHHGYTVHGYRSLIDRYLARGSQPDFQRAVMRVARDHAAIAGPLQEGVEISIVVGLLLGVAAPLAASAATLLLVGLGLSELGIYWPWELWPLALMALVVVLASLPVLHERGLRAWLVERPHARWPASLVAAGVGAALVLAVLHANREPREITVRSTVAVGLLLAGSAALDFLTARTRPRPPR